MRVSAIIVKYMTTHINPLSSRPSIQSTKKQENSDTHKPKQLSQSLKNPTDQLKRQD
jgi:hypothetical protein